MGELIYKILREPEWQSAREDGVFNGSADDKRDGFIHLSRGGQLKATFEKHFAGAEDLLLVALDAGTFGPELKWEISRGGDHFPHLYGPLKLTSVISIVAIHFDADGHAILPLDSSDQ
jgi:uncharacterized protein (DUF952 family)